ncbi:hypothetical protein K504DRAFT_423060 [Pleomassaria siparia CBS 279.74]|uniref:Zn(2)-C6 fungal-type domain-containing protein n=1 Tax=Pleomassaria siparia CBS 279.74 TaxID=1314801 RepID=A0A6G1KJU2_9PLEO|nr:hypothetical protein K504DRAFT_423060 [Pleomassaria siparia CBS 279.74]
METHQPSLQLANTDGTGPRKRRRTALSCVECRRRKVKCNRERPCGPCSKTKSPTCTFRPNSRITPQPTIAPDVAHPRSGSQHGSSLSSSKTNQDNTCDTDAILNRYIAPGTLGVHGNSTLGPLSVSNYDSSSQSSALTIRTLSARVNDLEGKLAALSNGGSSKNISYLARNSPSAPAGQFIKSKFYGESHWMNCIEPYEALGQMNQSIAVNPQTNKTEICQSTRLYTSIRECKMMARTIKSSRVAYPNLTPELLASIPTRAVCDQLVQCYLRTFEGIFRVLHIPTFTREYESYWENTAAAKPSVVTKILLVCAIGVPFYTPSTDGQSHPSLRSLCTKWIQSASLWLNSPHEKSRLNMAGLQIQILVLLARQICNVDGDLIWMPAGSLIRSAMHLGLHRDPSNFPKISTFHAEMRRRLWATVLEITSQSSLDMGMPPMISLNDYDTRLPENVNDEDIGDIGSMAPLMPRPEGEFTQTSIQIAFTQTLPMRLEMIRLMNDLRAELSYDDVLRLGSELLTTCRSNAQRMQSHLVRPPSGSTSAPNAFQLKLFDVLVRRFVLCLHHPFFAKAKTNPQYYYSRKVCLDISVSILTPVSPAGVEDDWRNLMTYGVGFVKSLFLYGLSTVYLELVARIEEMHEETPTVLPITPDSSPSVVPDNFHTLRSLLVASKSIAESRMRRGETNAKGVLFIDCGIARIDALVSGNETESAVLEAAERGVKECAKVMRIANANLDGNGYTLGGEEWSRGEGADMVFGAEGEDVEGVGAGEGWAEMEMEMDWNALMQDDSLGSLGEFGFDGTPEGWFVGGWDGM